MAETETPLISVHEASFRYPDGLLALDGVSLTIGQGEWVAVVGRNGCGKSTLCRLMNGLLLPDHGLVSVGGVDTRTRGSELEVRAAVAMVFQVPDNQIVATVVDQDVAFGPENLGVPPEELRLRVRAALETVGMWEQRERAPHLLSEGEKQRVAIAGALAMSPRCLILDEATSMLDPAAKKRVHDVVRRVHAEGVTVIFVTHDMAEAREAERLIALEHGRLAYDGSPRDLLMREDLMARLGLIAPPAARIGMALRRRCPSLPAGLLSPPEVAAAVAAVGAPLCPSSL
jgi:energy-coupling factor transporter ATPase